MSEQIENDQAAAELRDSITQADLRILELVNHRIGLVRQLRDHKRARGYPMVDPGREEWLVNHLRDANPGPLSDAGVRVLAERVIELTKSEVYETPAAPQGD